MEFTNEQLSNMSPEQIKVLQDLGIDIKADTGFLGTGMAGTDLLKGTLGLGQLGLGIASYLDQKNLMGKQSSLLDQQIASNAFSLNQAKNRQKDISKAFGSGLAASVK